MIRRSVIGLAVSLCLGSGCAYYSQEDGQRLANEVYALQTQVTALQQALVALQENEKNQKQQLGHINKELSELSKIARRNDADITVQIDDMLETVARMKGRVEAYDERMSNLEASTSKVQEELDLRFQGLAEQQKIEAAKSEEEKQRAIEDAKKRERLLSNPKAVFKETESLIKTGKPAKARKLVRELQVSKKDDKSFSKYRAHAQFLLGETYFAEGNFQQAAAEYNAVRKKFARSKWMPNSLFKLGLCFEKLGMKGDAKLFYQTVRKKYRKHKVSKDAAKRLKALKK